MSKETIQFSIRLPEDLKAQAEKQAEAERRSLNSLIVIAIENHLQAKKDARKRASELVNN